MIREDVGGIALETAARVVDIEQRIRIRTLALEAHPVIEAGARLIACTSHVPFSDERRLVTDRLKILREKQRAARHQSLVVDDSMSEGVESRQNRSATR